jgi:NAD(P)-dependent dehydrogenase (short-subunit alcohol dehydrogenase family)
LVEDSGQIMALMPRVSVPARGPGRASALAQALGAGPFAAVLLFVSPDADLARLAAEVAAAFGAVPVIGCTTAGVEGSQNGETEGHQTHGQHIIEADIGWELTNKVNVTRQKLHAENGLNGGHNHIDIERHQ